jgi:hypothetical protein
MLMVLSLLMSSFSVTFGTSMHASLWKWFTRPSFAPEQVPLFAFSFVRFGSISKYFAAVFDELNRTYF